jgi:DNA-binding MarR family transcriptional regulator
VIPATAAWNNIRRIHTHVARQLSAELDRHCAISLTTYNILDRIERTHTRLTDLLDVVALSPATLSRRIEKLETDGLVKRQPDPRDRRATQLTLTSAGRNLLAMADPIHHAGILRHLPAHLDAERISHLAAHTH